MAKRYQPRKEFGIQRLTKKPKLDITINRGSRPSVGGGGGLNHQPAESARPLSSNNNNDNNFWDDDDDEVILLATQVAENEAVALTQTQQPVMPETEITFSDFAPHVHASTSTQRPPEPQVPDLAVLTQIFCDDTDDDDFAMVAAAVEKQTNTARETPRDPSPLKQARFGVSEDLFKKPSSPVKLPPNEEVASSSAASTAASQSEARRQLASERQIKFLMERVDTLKKEKTKLSSDLEDTKAKLMVKDGETSLLRDEIRHMRQENHQLKLEKIEKRQPQLKPHDPLIQELSKQISVKESALQMRSMEYMSMRMKHADEVKRNRSMLQEINVSMRNDSIMMVDEEKVTTGTGGHSKRMSRRMRRNLLCLRQGEPPPLGEPLQPVSQLIFESVPKREASSQQRRTLFQLEFEQLQNCIAKLQLLKQQQLLTEDQVQQIASQTIDSVCKVFPELWSYVHSLEYAKNCRIYPYHSHQLKAADPIEDTRQSLHQPHELHEEERAITLRRYVATLSVICEQMPVTFSQHLLGQRHGQYLLMQIAIDAITQLGYSREICEHFGLLEAFAKLLRRLIKSSRASVEGETHLELLMNMLKQLIFTRPSPWIFREISLALLECVYEPKAVALMCVNSPADSFMSDRVKSIYRFTNESCVLQVYSGLLEIAFPLHSPLSPRRFLLLSQICLNHVRFVYYCLASPPKFVQCRLPTYDDDDEEAPTVAEPNYFDSTQVSAAPSLSCTAAENSVNATKPAEEGGVKKAELTCECYMKLCLSVVTLLFQVLSEWNQRERYEETSRVAEISRISVQLLHIIFCDNYITQLFRDAEETTKHYLFLICKWWQEHSDKLGFNQLQMNFLRKLQESHVMPRSIGNEGQLANIGKDLTEWYRLSKDDVSQKEAALRRDPAEALRNLRIMETAADPEQFFVGLNGYAFNFE